jgi:hypothetical protein
MNVASLRRVAVCGLLACLAAFAPARSHAVEIDFSTYAAVAYSESTGEYGYAWDQPSYGAAKNVALANCEADDAEIVGWVRGGWLVLAIGHDNSYGTAWEYGDGASLRVAATRAHNNCESEGGRVTKLICLCSGDVDPQIIKAEVAE